MGRDGAVHEFAYADAQFLEFGEGVPVVVLVFENAPE